MKTISLFFVSIILFVCGCAYPGKIVHRSGQDVYEGVAVGRGGSVFGASSDTIVLVNESKYYVDFYRDALFMVTVKPNEVLTVRPRAWSRPYGTPNYSQQAVFISQVYEMKGDDKKILRTHQEIISIGNERRPLHASWTIKSDLNGRGGISVRQTRGHDPSRNWYYR